MEGLTLYASNIHQRATTHYRDRLWRQCDRSDRFNHHWQTRQSTMHGYTRHRSSLRTSWLLSRVCSTPYLALSHLYCSTRPNRHWQRRMRSWRERERSGRMDWRLEASVPRWLWCSPSLDGILSCLPKCRKPMIRRLDLHLVTFYCNKRTTIYMVERVLGRRLLYYISSIYHQDG